MVPIANQFRGLHDRSGFSLDFIYMFRVVRPEVSPDHCGLSTLVPASGPMTGRTLLHPDAALAALSLRMRSKIVRKRERRMPGDMGVPSEAWQCRATRSRIRIEDEKQ